MTPRTRLAVAVFAASFSLLLYELLLVRLFAVVLFADFAHLALALALLGIGVGAIAQHLRPSLVPADAVERRLGWVALVQGVLLFLAVIAVIRFPILKMWEKVPETYQDRSHLQDDLLDHTWFALLLPVLAAPFCAAGLFFAALFQRRKQDIAYLYGADLLGAAAAALVFVPLLMALAGPDVAFVPAAASFLAAALLLRIGGGNPLPAWGLTGLATVAALVATRVDVLKIREAAGYSDTNVVYTEWTPLTRLAIHRDARGDFMLLDNASASEIFRTEARRTALATEANRALVYRFHQPPARVAILAASAGPEVGVAQSLGYTKITAIDIAGDIFDIVADRYPDSPVNPYLVGDTNRVNSDGRAAILRSTEPYDIIQMVHANLWSSAGMLSNAWSPALLETKEAFTTYLDHLAPDGTISFGRGSQSGPIVRAAIAALMDRGVADPWHYIAYLGGGSRVLLVKQRPWTAADRAALDAALLSYPASEILIDPLSEKAPRLYQEILRDNPVLTDDHPYSDSPAAFSRTVKVALGVVKGQEGDEALAVLYRSIVVQCGFALLAGLIFLGLPLLLRGRTEMARVRGVAPVLLYVSGLGYGYLAVETVLINKLVLFVGHPTYAVTVVVLAMLTGSGAGSIWAARPAPETRTLRLLLLAVLALGLFQGIVVPRILYSVALHWPLALRIGVTFLALLPLGFVMGTAFPFGTRLLPESATPVLPWAWAINGWMSVVGSLVTVLVARLWGFPEAFGGAMIAYLVAFLAAGGLARAQAR